MLTSPFNSMPLSKMSVSQRCTCLDAQAGFGCKVYPGGAAVLETGVDWAVTSIQFQVVSRLAGGSPGNQRGRLPRPAL